MMIRAAFLPFAMAERRIGARVCVRACVRACAWVWGGEMSRKLRRHRLCHRPISAEQSTKASCAKALQHKCTVEFKKSSRGRKADASTIARPLPRSPSRARTSGGLCHNHSCKPMADYASPRPQKLLLRSLPFYLSLSPSLLRKALW